MTSVPLVSIVIPVFNGANFLAEAIESALAQRYRAFEVVVVNDGSTDGGATARIAKGFLPMIRYFEQTNGGVSVALNRGIRESRGELISWLSHDDLLLPDKLERQVAAFRRSPAERVVPFGDFEVEDLESGRRFMDSPPSRLVRDDPKATLTLLFLARMHGCTLLVPRRALEDVGDFNPALRTTQDYDLWFRMVRAGYRFVHEPGAVIRTRWHRDQGTRTMSAVHRREASALYSGAIDQLAGQIRELGARDAIAVSRSLVARGLGEQSAQLLTAWAEGAITRRGLRAALTLAYRFRRSLAPT